LGSPSQLLGFANIDDKILEGVVVKAHLSAVFPRAKFLKGHPQELAWRKGFFHCPCHGLEVLRPSKYLWPSSIEKGMGWKFQAKEEQVG